jgi:hypothetical protein
VPAVLGLAACADLQPAETGVCGNDVIDAQEDCDGHAVSASAECAPPGSAHECRYVCGTATPGGDGAVAQCPTGFGCGLDGVCRQFTGGFSLDSAPAAISSFALTSGHFNADGKAGVFVLGDDLGDGRRFSRVVDTGSSNAALGIPIAVPIAQPSIGDINGDGYDDVAYVDYSGIGVLRAEPAPDQPLFLAYPSAVFASPSIELRAVGVPLAPGPHGEDDGDAIVLLEDDGTTFAVRTLEAPNVPLLDLSTTQKRASDIAGDVLLEAFDSRPGACKAMVIPLTGLPYLPVFPPCADGAWAAAGSQALDVALAGGATVQGPALAIDVDGDKNEDLVVTTDQGAYVAFGRGDGTFTSTADPSGAPNLAEPLVLSWESGQIAPTDPPLAGGDLNGDGRTDFVFPGGLALADAAGALYWAYRSSGWAEATVTTAEGGTPLVAAASQSAGVNFLVYSAGTGQFASTWVPTANLASHLTPGDYDGDGVTDIAYIEHSDLLGDTWSVIYGSEAYIPTAPVPMATFDTIRQLSAAHLAAPTVGADAIGDLVISAKLAPGDADTVATSLGSPTRQMLTPYQLRDPDGTQVLPLAVTAGTFISSQHSLAVLGADDPQGAGTLRFWFFTPDKAGATDLVMGGALSSSFHPSSFGGNDGVDLRYGAHLATGNFDEDGADDVAMIAPYGPDDTESALVVAEIDGGVVTTTDPIVIPVQSTLYSFLRVADADGDGADDILFKGLDDDTPSFVTVFWNDGAGGFDAGRTSQLNVDGGIKDFVCVPGSTPCTLYALSEDQLFVIAIAKDRSTQVSEVAGVGGGWSITTGDFDGDGLQDLAIGDPTDLRLYHALPRLP